MKTKQKHPISSGFTYKDALMKLLTSKRSMSYIQNIMTKEQRTTSKIKKCPIHFGSIFERELK
jgi:hypothetical protein